MESHELYDAIQQKLDSQLIWGSSNQHGDWWVEGSY